MSGALVACVVADFDVALFAEENRPPALFVFGWLMMALLVLLAAVAQKFSAKRTKETLLHIWEEFSDGKGGKP